MHPRRSLTLAAVFSLFVLTGCPGPDKSCQTDAQCDDGNACTADACVAKACTHSDIAVEDDGNACTADACDPASGMTHTPVSVDDRDACTNDACDPRSGALSHTPVSVDDANACTADVCNPATGEVTHTLAIDDMNACTTDTCNPRTGVTHTPVNVDDGNACTTDSCNPATGAITHAPPMVDDNNVCTTDACDPTNGMVSHTPVGIDDGNACTADACDPVAGVSHTTINPDDNNVCTRDACDPITGVSHTPISVDDMNACTADACDPVTGPSHTPVDPNDNNACTTDACDRATGVSHTPVDPSDNNACTADACDPVTGVSHTPVDISDSNVCTTDACDPASGISHTPVDISDSNACTADACDPVSGISHTPINPDDMNACTIDACDRDTGVSHTPVDVSDSDACTADACDPATGAISHTPIDPNDNNVCTADSCDPVTGVHHDPVDASDGIPCTDDLCDPVTGAISHTPVDSRCEADGLSCTVPHCDAAAGCSEAPSDSACNDSVGCTVDQCVGAGGAPGTGCLNSPHDAQCPALQVCRATGCTPAIAADQVGNVIITELRILGSELIEIRNNTMGTLDVHAFVFENSAGQLADLRAPTDLTGTAGTPVNIPPGGYAYGVPNPSSGTVPATAAFVYGDIGTTFALNDSGDILSVHSRNGSTLQDYVDFRSLVTDPNAVQTATSFPGYAGATTQLDPASLDATGNDSGANWCTTFYPATGRSKVADTAGAANGSCRNVAVINEVVIDAINTDDGKTFLEIAGPGGALIGGAKIEDLEGSAGTTAGTRNDPQVALPAGVRIPVDGLLIVADGTSAGTTSVPNVAPSDVIVADMDLENSGTDAVQLIASDGTLLDVLGHDPNGAALAVPTAFNGLAMWEGNTALTPPVGAALARSAASSDSNDNRADFHSDPSPTPGMPSDAINFTVTGFSPDDGLATVATTLTVTGTDFATGAAITIGTRGPTGCSVLSSTRMTCTAPNNSGVAARVNVTIANPTIVGGGTATFPNGFTYTGVLNERDLPLEADYCVLQWPPTTTVTQGQTTELIYGRIYEAGLTEPDGAPPGVLAEVGYGPTTANPTTQAGWQFFPATFNLQYGNDDEFMASLTAPAVAAQTNYSYTVRFSLDNGLNFTYCDLDGAGSNAGFAFDPAQLGVMTVTP